MNAFEVLPFSKEVALAWIVILPLAGALINGVWGKGAPQRLVGAIGVGSVAGSFLLALACFSELIGEGYAPKAAITSHLYDWFTLHIGSRSIPVSVEFVMDALSGIMTLFVTGIGLLIHIYSLGYMAEDKSFRRFFAYLNLFMASMLILVLGGSFPVLFVGWEGVGLCSYLLIGFWFENRDYAMAGKKAFIANRVGDFGVIIGMFILMMATGSLDFAGINANTDALKAGFSMPPEASYTLVGLAVVSAGMGIAAILMGRARVTWGWFAGVAMLVAVCVLFFEIQDATLATAACLFLFLGCTGKSAQIPLFVWLPDAMAGPTPVSALIHAATMVTSGIYLCCRLSPVFSTSPGAMATIAIIGAATALLAASVAVVQNEMKRILAYSTVSQLGFMFAAVGSGAFAAGIFHVFTHAFFKACLFLGAGAVMHAVHAHGDADVRLLGGMKKHLPVVRWTFLVSCMAISGVPLFSGWFSKDEILNGAYASAAFFGKEEMPSVLGSWVGYGVFITLFIAAAMTAYYMFRLYFLTFSGETYRSAHVHADGSESDDHHGEEGEDHTHGYAAHPHPPEPAMAWPLRVLAVGAIAAGLLHLKPLVHLLHSFWHPSKATESFWEHWLATTVSAPTRSELDALAAAGAKGYAPAVMGFAAMAIGVGIAYSRFSDGKGVPGDETPTGLIALLKDKWRVDEVYEAMVIEPIRMLATICAAIDKYFVDFVLTRATAATAAASGFILSRLQTGVVYAYGAVMLIGLLGVGAWFLKPHPGLEVDSVDGVTAQLSAAKGHGYSYRWDVNGDGDFSDPGESEAFGADEELSHSYTGNESDELVLHLVGAGDKADDDLIVTSSSRVIPFAAVRNWVDARYLQPAYKQDGQEVVIRPNSAEGGGREEIRLKLGESVFVGGRKLVIARRVHARVEVRNAFGYTTDESESFVIFPSANTVSDDAVAQTWKAKRGGSNQLLEFDKNEVQEMLQKRVAAAIGGEK